MAKENGGGKNHPANSTAYGWLSSWLLVRVCPFCLQICSSILMKVYLMQLTQILEPHPRPFFFFPPDHVNLLGLS